MPVVSQITHGLERGSIDSLVHGAERGLIDGLGKGASKEAMRAAEMEAKKLAEAEAKKLIEKESEKAVAEAELNAAREGLAKAEGSAAKKEAEKKLASAEEKFAQKKVALDLALREEATALSKATGSKIANLSENELETLLTHMKQELKGKGSKIKGFKRLIYGAVFVACAAEVLLLYNLDSEEQCLAKCTCPTLESTDDKHCEVSKSETSEGGGFLQSADCTSLKNLPCQTTDKDTCKKYCKEACTQEARARRSMCKIEANPLNAILDTLGGIANSGGNTLTMLWELLKNGVYVLILICVLPFVWKLGKYLYQSSSDGSGVPRSGTGGPRRGTGPAGTLPGTDYPGV